MAEATTAQHTDSLTVAILTGMAGLIGSALGVIGVLRSARVGVEGAIRQVQIDHAIIGRREAYLDLANLLVRLRVAARYPDPEHGLKTLIEYGSDVEWFMMQARVELYASNSVRIAFDDILSQRTKLIGAGNEWLEARKREDPGKQETDSLKNWRNSQLAADSATRSLLDLMKDEVAPD